MAELCGISIKTEIGSESNEIEWSNELDHAPFLLRRKLLLSRRLNLTSTATNSMHQENVVVKKEDEQCDSQVFPVSKEIGRQSVQLQNHETKVSLGVDPVVAYKCSQNGTACQELAMPGDSDSHTTEVHRHTCLNQSSTGDSVSGSFDADLKTLKLESSVSSDSNDFADDLDHIILKERHRMLLPSKLVRIVKPIPEETPMESNSSDTISNMPASRNGTSDSTLLNLVKVKAEPLDNSQDEPGITAAGNLSLNLVSVKSELDCPGELHRDKVDDMQMQQRMKLQTLRKVSKSSTSGNFECSGKVLPSSLENGPADPEAPNPIRISRPRKRRKTATDSIETALEEDAPGLLQVLIEQGVSVGEIKLYGETDNDEPIDESSIEDGFTELEAVISKIFFQQNSLLKFATLKCAKGSKSSYCLGCLFSLVEQTRYLRFRNWPAEWGWCRDLQSFVFVFERHKRIVLERPEYGYATYFFELVDSLPIDWQIKRLVTSMKLTNCGRINLIENKTLVVGEDLTEGEAEVLMQYGWTPNSGLGTMLNYRDRVFHDRKNEKDSSEWRSKIGKLLMDGFNGGSIVSSSIEAKVSELRADENPEIKTEL
ncbi:uncharacterized protein LOC8272187 isoform X1 [Ricinus communis]|uniref:uncharacterized protein LOC8272187 isoform X1 n=1 Tax=Ricinus communis TaxID=3988 RepID=UPI00201A3BEC|nr:uncharacterized protein LOC8272187 isoform X1 [Ricinus communis]